MTFTESLDTFLGQALRDGSLDDVRDAARNMVAHAQWIGPDQRNGALVRLAKALDVAHPVPAAVIAISCGALVEEGGDPGVAGPSVIGRLTEHLADLTNFYAHCQDSCDPSGIEGAAGELLPKLLETDPPSAWAYLGREEMAQAALAHLARSKPLRHRARTTAGLLAASLAVDAAAGARGDLTVMLRVLDDEDLLVLCPGQNKGFQVTITGVADNYQLQTLLEGALIGDPASGWLDGPRPDPRVVDAARAGDVDPGRIWPSRPSSCRTGRRCAPTARCLPRPTASTGSRPKGFRPTLPPAVAGGSWSSVHSRTRGSGRPGVGSPCPGASTGSSRSGEAARDEA